MSLRPQPVLNCPWLAPDTCSVDLKREGLSRVVVCDIDPGVLRRSHEGIHIAVQAAVDHEVVDVQKRRPAVPGLVLAIGRGDRDDATDVEAVVQRKRRVVGVTFQRVQRRGHGDRLAAAGVPDQDHAVHVDLAREAVFGVDAPVGPQAKVLQHQPATSVVLFFETRTQHVREVGV